MMTMWTECRSRTSRPRYHLLRRSMWFSKPQAPGCDGMHRSSSCCMIVRWTRIAATVTMAMTLITKPKSATCTQPRHFQQCPPMFMNVNVHNYPTSPASASITSHTARSSLSTEHQRDMGSDTQPESAVSHSPSPASPSPSFLTAIEDIVLIPLRSILFLLTFIGLDMSPSLTNSNANRNTKAARGIVRITPTQPALLRLRHAQHYEDDTATQQKEIEQKGTDEDLGVSLNEWIARNVPALKSPFKPCWWLPNGHLQTFFTVVGNFTKVDPVHYIRTYLRLPDGGTIGLDTTPENHHELPPDAPTVVVSHGLTGGSHESYVRNVLAWVIKPKSQGGLGGRGIVVNDVSRIIITDIDTVIDFDTHEGAGVPITSCQLYSAGTTMDLALALHHIRHRYPASPLIGIGFSLGASIMSRYLGEAGSDSLLSAATVLGCPWDLEAGSNKLEEPWFTSHVYSSALAQNILRMFFNVYNNNPGAFNDAAVNAALPELRALQKQGRKARLKNVDDLLVSQIGGPKGIGAWPFANAVEYYRWASPKRLLAGVKVPLFALNAFDDPVVDTTSLPLEELQGSSHVYVAVTGSGGHLGWFDGPFSSSTLSKHRWILNPVSEFFIAASRDFPISPKVEVKHGEEQAGDEGWEWVTEPAHDIPGLERVGWKVLQEGEVVQGEDQSGVMQGL